ncbi:MAG: TetR/AcrR family transcriptional regulator [Bacteroidetes bacterium]|nr:TetR/AcrR family transcriptional regulator [Bacteroidota bacterium]
MTTRETIIALGDQLIRDKGFNAFSFYDIARSLNIKNASIHYHFPSKTDLGIAVLKGQQDGLRSLIEAYSKKTPEEKLLAFLSIYTRIKAEGKVCIVGSLATDLNSVDEKIAVELKKLAQEILSWVTQILDEGKRKKVFYFRESSRTRALLIITNMLAALQVSRLTDENDFSSIKNAIIKDLRVKP